MKILLLVKHFDFGGAENHVCELANELVNNGEQVWLFSGKGRQLKRLSQKVVHLPAKMTDWNMGPLIFRLIFLVRREKIQLIHAHQRLPIWLATAVGLLTGTKVVGTIHGTALHDIRSRFVKRCLGGIIVISENSYSIHRKNPKIQDKVYFLPNSFHIPAKLQEQAPPLPPFRLYYVSRQDQRHANLLVNIVANVWPRFLMKHPGSTFHLVGDGCGCHKIANLLKSREEQPWIESIICEGYVDEVAQILGQAHMVMGVGRVIGESLSQGIPTLSIKWNHLGPILTRENFEALCYTNFVSLSSPPPEPDQLLELLEEFIDRSVFYQQEAQYLRNIVSQRFDIKDGIVKTLEVYDTIYRGREGV